MTIIFLKIKKGMALMNIALFISLSTKYTVIEN
jgi:hypothetical protein